jgi:hypothetical protein
VNINNDNNDPFSGESCVDVNGNVTVTGNINETAIGFLDVVRSINGNLTIQGTGNQLNTIDLAGLLAITNGELIVQDVNADALFADALLEVGGVNINTNASLTTVTMASLEGVRGTLRLADNDALDTIDFGSLVVVEGDVEVTNNPQLCEEDVATIVAGLTNYDGTTTNTGNLNCN